MKKIEIHDCAKTIIITYLKLQGIDSLQWWHTTNTGWCDNPSIHESFSVPATLTMAAHPMRLSMVNIHKSLLPPHTTVWTVVQEPKLCKTSFEHNALHLNKSLDEDSYSDAQWVPDSDRARV